ncbi:MAG: substrate-binding domain-containing protein [bacterium]
MLRGDFDPYWREVEMGVRAFAERAREGVDYRVFPDPNPDEAALTRWQIENLGELAGRRDLTAVAVAPLDHEKTLAHLKKLTQKGVPCITFDTDSPYSGRLFYIGTNNYLAGSTAGYQMAKLLEFHGKVMVHTPTMKTFSCTERIRGFTESLSRYEKIGIVQAESGEEQHEKLVESAGKCLLENPDVRGIFAASGTSVKACARVLAEAKPEKPPEIITFDIDREIAALLKSGVIFLAMVQRPHTIGQRVVDYLVRIARHGVEKTMKAVPGTGIIDTGTRTVFERTLDAYRQTQQAFGIPVDF